MRVRARIVGLVAVSVLACGLAFGCVSASALEIYVPEFSFGPAGVGGAGSFVNTQSIAVDGSGDVYVYDREANGGSIYKFDSSGKPVSFSALGSNAIEGVGGAGSAENEIAVSSAGATAGDIYVAHFTGRVAIYAPDGTALGELNGGGPGWGRSCGVATDPSGNVYVSLNEGYVDRYEPKANPVTNADYTRALYGLVKEPCNIAVDSAENVYEVRWEKGPVTMYESSQFNILGTAASGKEVDPAGSTLAVDLSTNEVFVDEGTQVSQFEWTGTSFNPPQRFPLAGGAPSYGIAVKGGDHEVYVANPSSGKVEAFKMTVARPPAVNEPPPSASVTRTRAVLAGTVHAESTDTTYRFVYGTTEAYGSSTATVNVGAAGGPTGPVVIDELSPGTTYHYALIATNEVGTTTGPDHTFTTPITPPKIDAETASEIGRASVTLSGSIDPEGLETVYGFEIGTEAGEYGPGIPTGSQSRPGAQAVLLRLSGLTSGTTYHYRIYATSGDGTSYGADETFTTPDASSPLIEPAAPPLLATPMIVFPTETGASGKPPAKRKAKAKRKVRHRSKARGRGPRKKPKKR